MIYGIIGFGNENALEYPKFLFCGSFNPLHEGHVAIVDYIYNKFGVPVDFEISHSNVEKADITVDDMRKRYDQMRTMYKPSFGRLYMTDCARYLEKAEHFPDTTFVCGFDTMKAMACGRYYEKFDLAIERINELGIKWLVFPRQKEDGTISTADDYKDFPPELLKNITIVDDWVPINMRSRELRK